MSSLDDETLAEVTNAFRRTLPRSYLLNRSADERHGSWEWAGERRDRALRRYVVLACTQLTVAYGSGQVTADFWTAAEFGRNYFRTQVGHAETVDGQSVAAALEEPIARFVPIAATRADQLTRADLDTSYPSFDVLHLDVEPVLTSFAAQSLFPPRREIEQEVVRTVRERPGISLADLADLLRVSSDLLSPIVRALGKKGLLKEANTGALSEPTYQLPPGSSDEP